MGDLTNMDLEFLTGLCNGLSRVCEGLIDDNGGLHVDFVCLDRFQQIKGIEGTLRAWIKQEENIMKRASESPK
jgi:hypothetical protein